MSNPGDPYSQSPQNDPYAEHKQYNPGDPYSQYPQSDPYAQQDRYNSNEHDKIYPQPERVRPIGVSPQGNRKRWTGCLGCFITVVVLVCLSLGMCVISSLYAQFQPPAFLYQRDPPFNIFYILLSVFGVVAGIVILLSMLRKSKAISIPARASFILLFAVIVIGSLLAVFWSNFINPNIGMTRTGFLRTNTVSVSNGETVRFRNPVDGITQILCVGVDQHCQPQSGDPSQLDRRLVIKPGQTVNLVFNTDGEYQITSKTTPHMNLTISVSTNNTD